MKAEEIRALGLECRDPSETLTGNVQDCAWMLRETAAQLADLNASRKPRWIRFDCEGGPVIINAASVTAVWPIKESLVSVTMGGPGYEGRQTVTEPLEQVLVKLGIEETPAPVRLHPDYLPINKAEWDAAHAAVEAARHLIDPSNANLGAHHRDTLKEAIAKFDDFQMPF